MRLLLMSPGESSQNPRKGTQIRDPPQGPTVRNMSPNCTVFCAPWGQAENGSFGEGWCT